MDEGEWANRMDALTLHWRQQVPERRQGRSRRREQDILEAALRVFSRQGIARARIADIAAEAGMPLSSLYEYYPSKEEIAYAVPVSSMARFFIEYAAAARSTVSFRERLRKFLVLSADFARRNPDWARTLYLEIWPSVLVKDSPSREILDDWGRFIVELVQNGERAGEWPSGPNPYETATILIGSHNQLVITWLLYRKPRDIMRAIGPLVDRTMDAILPVPQREVQGAHATPKPNEARASRASQASGKSALRPRKSLEVDSALR